MSRGSERSQGTVQGHRARGGELRGAPYFRVGDRNAGTGIMQFENQLRTKDGNVMQQSWVVRAAHGGVCQGATTRTCTWPSCSSSTRRGSQKTAG